jgi:predicted permease
VAGLTLCWTALAAAISALLPALLGSRRLDLLAALRADARAHGGAGRPRVRQGLATLQVAAAVVLLVTTGLLLETYRRLNAQGPGARVEGLVHARLSLPPRSPKTQDAVEAFVARVRESVRAVPGVRSVGVTNALPMSGLNNRSDFVIVGREPRQASELPGGQLRWISPGLAEALALPLRRGRLFSEHDEQARTKVALVDEVLARRFWPRREAIGEGLRLEFGGPLGPVFQVVGVVGSVKHFDLAEEPLGTLYLPVHGLQDPFRPFFAAGISVAAAGDVEDGATRRRFAAALLAVDPDVPVSPVASMGETIGHALATRGFTAAVLAVFAAAALLLAVSGLYAVVSAGVASQKRELGLRVAMGAAPVSVVRSALRPAVQALGLGLPAGLLLAVGVARALGAEIDARLGTAVWVIAPLCLALAGLVAAIVPARRALRLDLVRILASG